MTTQTIPVYFVTNWDMVGYTATTMASILSNTKHNCDFYVMDCGLSDFDRKQLSTMKDKFSNLKSLSFATVDVKQFEGMNVWYYGMLDAWAMLLFPQAFPNIKKVVHVESDTILVNDIADLYNQDLESYTVGACPDIAFGNFSELFNSPNHKYFNLGMMVINCEKWRKEKVTEKCLELGKKYGKQFNCLHQDALNMVFENNYKILPHRFNLGERANLIKNIFPDLSDEYFANEWKHPYLIHFSPNKPWRSQNNYYSGRISKYFNEWWFYASMTPYIEGLKNCFIASRISDGFKGFRLGMDDYGNNLLDTLGKDHPWQKFVGGCDFSISEKKALTNHYKLLGLPLLKIKTDTAGSKHIKLFNLLPILKVKKDIKGNKTYKLFSFLPIFRIKRKQRGR